MARKTNQFLLNLFLAFVWMFLHTNASFKDFVAGYILGAALIYLLARKVAKQPFYLVQLGYAIKLTGIFFWELIKSSFSVMLQVFQPQLKIRPGIIKMDIYLDKPAAITLLANLITLTPGTLTMEVAPDNTALYIHTLVIDDADQICAGIESTFEENILRVFKGVRKGGAR